MKRKLTGFLAVLSLLLSSAAPLYAQSRPNLAAKEGKDCRLVTPTFVAADAPLSLEVLRSVQKHDQANIMALAASRKIRPVERGDRARVIDSDWRSHALKIRVLNGPSIGLEG